MDKAEEKNAEARFLFSRIDLAGLFDIHPETISRMTQRGDLPPVDYKGRYDLRKVLHHLYTKLKGRGEASQGTYDARLKKAKAEHMELALARARRDVVPVDEVIRALAPAIVVCRSGILGLPERLAMLVPTEQRNPVQREARSICDKLLREFDDAFRTYHRASAGGDDDSAPESRGDVDAPSPNAESKVGG